MRSSCGWYYDRYGKCGPDLVYSSGVANVFLASRIQELNIKQI